MEKRLFVLYVPVKGMSKRAAAEELVRVHTTLNYDDTVYEGKYIYRFLIFPDNTARYDEGNITIKNIENNDVVKIEEIEQKFKELM